MAATRRERSGSFVETRDGTAIYYEDWGSGRAVLFLHGSGTGCRMWHSNMVSLVNQGLRCIAYDMRGHGRSSVPGSGYDYDSLADDLGEVIVQLGLRDVVLVAHSMGAGQAVRYATRHGSERIRGIVMVGPTLPFLLKTPDNPEGIDRAVFEKLRMTWLADFPKWVSDNARPFFVPETSEQMVQWGVNLMTQSSLRAVIECNRSSTETDFRTELTRLAIPVLIVHGDRDASARLELTGRKAVELIPDCELKVYEGAAHGLFITHAAAFNEDVLDFIGSHQ